MHTDSHIHLMDFYRASGFIPVLPSDITVCASAHQREEFMWQEDFAMKNPFQVLLSFGIHPQDREMSSADKKDFLQILASERRIQAIGECGFDLFTPEFRETEKEQQMVWNFQLDLAAASGLSLIIHCRKAMGLVFADIKKLKKVRAVVFHGWSGSVVEAKSFLSRGVNAYFSAGKGLLRGDRSLRESVTELPGTTLLTETDSPYMVLKGEKYSVPEDIYPVTALIARLRQEGLDELQTVLSANFRTVFGAHPGSRPAP